MSMEELMARREWLAKHETELLAGLRTLTTEAAAEAAIAKLG